MDGSTDEKQNAPVANRQQRHKTSMEVDFSSAATEVAVTTMLAAVTIHDNVHTK